MVNISGETGISAAGKLPHKQCNQSSYCISANYIEVTGETRYLLVNIQTQHEERYCRRDFDIDYLFRIETISHIYPITSSILAVERYEMRIN